LKLCAGLRARNDGEANAKAVPLEFAPARKTICGRREWPDFIHMVCSGWAMTAITLADGRRQILSFLLPGEGDSTLNIFRPRFGRSIEAVSDVLYRRFRREDVREKLRDRPDLLDVIGPVWGEESERSDGLLVDLGQRTADERIARQLLNLADRLAKRGMVTNGVMEFPLRRRHMADLTGLTPVHVSRIMNELQRAGVIEITDRQLKILDTEKLRRIAEYR
jgi:CRP-like cAMP-binding protein